MFLICSLLIGLIVVAIATKSESSIEPESIAIPVRVESRNRH